MLTLKTGNYTSLPSVLLFSMYRDSVDLLDFAELLIRVSNRKHMLQFDFIVENQQDLNLEFTIRER